MFRKIFFTILCLFVLSGSAFAAQTDWYVDTTCAEQGDGTIGTCSADGIDPGAWNTMDTGFQNAGVTDGDVTWVRRTSAYDEGVAARNANIATLNNIGDADEFVHFISWPRHADSWDCDWTNGSTTVDNIDENDADREKHQGRFITGPDGFNYLITDITDANTVIIDRPYAGTTAANEVCVIIADTVPSGVVEPADPNSWDSDADDLPSIDFNDENYTLYVYGDVASNYIFIQGFNLLDSTSNAGILNVNRGVAIAKYCLFHQSTQNDPSAGILFGELIINQCIFDGPTGDGILWNGYSSLYVKNSAIYDCVNGIEGRGTFLYLENVNIGVEVANTDDDFLGTGFTSINGIIARDLKLGGTNGYFQGGVNYSHYESLTSVNNGKVLGAWKKWLENYTFENVAVTGTNANKKLSDSVIEITPPTTASEVFTLIEAKHKVFESRKTYDAGTYNIKLWIFNDTGNTLNDTTFSDDILMRCRAEAGNYGDATTEYVSMPWTYSDEIDILDAADADDWDYLQCDSVVVDQASKIYCEVLVSTYDADADVILIDPVTSNP